jgi:hypothetical protein
MQTDLAYQVFVLSAVAAVELILTGHNTVIVVGLVAYNQLLTVAILE